MNKQVGNILELKEGILVHGCNCQGVMGGGIAKLIRDKWLGVYQAYKTYHSKVGLRLGDVVNVSHFKMRSVKTAARHIHDVCDTLPERLIVVNAMTQDDYGSAPGRVYVDYDAIEAAFSRIALLARDTGLPVHFPLIGCGLAKGRWEDVEARIERAMPNVDKTLWTLP